MEGWKTRLALEHVRGRASFRRAKNSVTRNLRKAIVFPRHRSRYMSVALCRSPFWCDFRASEMPESAANRNIWENLARIRIRNWGSETAGDISLLDELLFEYLNVEAMIKHSRQYLRETVSMSNIV